MLNYVCRSQHNSKVSVLKVRISALIYPSLDVTVFTELIDPVSVCERERKRDREDNKVVMI